MRFDLGCGDACHPGCVGIDRRPTPDNTLVACVEQLPLRDNCADEIVAFDILEHFPRHRTRQVLAEWRRVMKPEALLRLRVPNLAYLALLLPRDPVSVIENIYGGHRYGPDGAWDRHEWGWTPETIEQDLRVSGFAVLANDRQANMSLEARKCLAVGAAVTHS